MEENRKRALQIRQMKMKEQKRLKSSSETAASSNSNIVGNPITPAPAVSKQKSVQESIYAKARTTYHFYGTSNCVGHKNRFKEANPNNNKEDEVSSITSISPVISAWGDCRLDLWEAACQCGGAAKHSLPTFACVVVGQHYLDAGLDCGGCGGGTFGVVAITKNEGVSLPNDLEVRTTRMRLEC